MSAATCGSGLLTSPTNGHPPLVRGGPKTQPKSMLVLSGGEGYIDFRLGTCFESISRKLALFPKFESNINTLTRSFVCCCK